jgi:hypothetical protein
MSLTVFMLVAVAMLAWASTFLLVTRAVRKPRIGALTERAALSVLLSLFGTLCVLLVYNTETGNTLIPTEVARALFRVCLFLLLFVSPAWVLLYATNRLGGGR